MRRARSVGEVLRRSAGPTAPRRARSAAGTGRSRTPTPCPAGSPPCGSGRGPCRCCWPAAVAASSSIRCSGLLVVLHEHEVPVLQEALVLAAGQISRRCRSPGRGRRRAPSTDRTGPVGPACQKFSERGQSHDALARARPAPASARSPPRRDRARARSSPSNTVTQMSSSAKPNTSRDSSHADRDRLALEVVAEREVPEHLEERQVACGVADVVDVDRAKDLLAARQARRRRGLLAEEVGLQRVHPGDRQQRRGVVRGWHERGRGNALVPALLEEAPGSARVSRLRSSCEQILGGARA